MSVSTGQDARYTEQHVPKVNPKAWREGRRTLLRLKGTVPPGLPYMGSDQGF